MSTENFAGPSWAAQNQKKSTRINIPAYEQYLQEYCEILVQKNILTKVDTDHAFGKFRGLTYQLPKDGKKEGNWIRLRNLSTSRSGKPVTYEEIDPNTKKPLTNAAGNVKCFRLFDLIGRIKRVNNWDRGSGFAACRMEAIEVLGGYVGKQMQNYGDKLVDKAIEEENRKTNLTPAQLKEDTFVREHILKEMNQKLLAEIQKSGTLFGTETQSMPVKITSQHVAYVAKDRIINGMPRESFIGFLPEGSIKPILKNKVDEQGRVIDRTVVNDAMKGLLYVAAMQDGEKDKRYMELNDMLNSSRFTSRGIKNPIKGEKNSANYVYGANFGFRDGKDGVSAPKILVEKKGAKPVINSTTKMPVIDPKTGKAKTTGGYDLYTLEDPILAEVNHQVLSAVWVEHSGTHDHLTQKHFVNISQMSVRPLSDTDDPNDHDHDFAMLTSTQTTATNRDKYIKDVAERAKNLYGISISDEDAFMQDPIGEMRNIISQGTKIRQDVIGGARGTENDKIINYGMRAFQRELTLDYIMRSCGYKDGIVIPERDRPAICRWISDDMQQNNKGLPGQRLVDATIAMDKNNVALLGMSQAEKEKQNEAIRNREKFKNLSVSFVSDYTNSQGKVVNKAGLDKSWVRPIEKMDAYNVLADICYQDKYLYSHPENENHGKKVVFNISINGQEFKNVSLSLGHLDTGNEANVADALLTLMVKNEKTAAFSKEDIDKKYNAFETVKKAGLVRDEYASVNNKLDFVGVSRDKYIARREEMRHFLTTFAEDEANYKKTLEIEGKLDRLQNLNLEADVYRYEVPTKDTSRLYEAYGMSNIVRIVDPHEKDTRFDPHVSSVVELRRPLEPLRDEEGNNIMCTKAAASIPKFADLTTRRAKATEPLEAIPYLKQSEWAMKKDLDDHFSIEYQAAPNLPAEKFSGIEARDQLMFIAYQDAQWFEKEKEGFRSIQNVDPIKVVAKWDDEVVFDKSGRMGSKAFSNVHSVEELLGSQKEGLSEEGQKALNSLLEANKEEQKYGDNRDFNTSLKDHEILDEKEIDKILKQNKQVEEYRDEANKEGLTLMDLLETEAAVNFKNSDQEYVNYLVDGMMKHADNENPGCLKNPETMKNIAETIRKSPEHNEALEECLKKSLERKSVQKKVTKSLGIKRKGPTDDYQR